VVFPESGQKEKKGQAAKEKVFSEKGPDGRQGKRTRQLLRVDPTGENEHRLLEKREKKNSCERMFGRNREKSRRNRARGRSFGLVQRKKAPLRERTSGIKPGDESKVQKGGTRFTYKSNFVREVTVKV